MDRRQLDEVGPIALTAPEVDKSRAAFGDANRVFGVSITLRLRDELPQSRHLGELRNQRLGGVWRRDADLRWRNDKPVASHRAEIHRVNRQRNLRTLEHVPILPRCGRQTPKWLLVVMKAYSDMTKDEPV